MKRKWTRNWRGKFVDKTHLRYGGSCVNSENESFEEAKKEEQKINLTVPAHGKVCIYQYEVGMGNKAYFFSKQIEFTDCEAGSLPTLSNCDNEHIWIKRLFVSSFN